MRMPYAMRTLTNEIGEVNEDAHLELKNADGFGVWRTLLLDRETTEMLTPLLDELIDQRVSSKDIAADRYSLTFVTDRRADDATPFGLASAYRVLTSPPAASNEERQLARIRREAELMSMKVGELRSTFGYRHDWRKVQIVEDILDIEGH